MTHERRGWHRPPTSLPGQERHFIGTTAAIIMGLTAAASTASSVYGAKQQSKANTQAANMQAGANQLQIDFAKEQAKIAQENYDKTAAEDRRRYEADAEERKREFEATFGNSSEANKLARDRFNAGAPYRALGTSAANTMGAILARHFGGSPASGSGDASATMGDLLKTSTPPQTPGPASSSTPAPTSSYGRMPTQTMADLFTSPTDLARPPDAVEAPYVYMRDAGGRMIAVPRSMVPQGARA